MELYLTTLILRSAIEKVFNTMRPRARRKGEKVATPDKSWMKTQENPVPRVRAAFTPQRELRHQETPTLLLQAHLPHTVRRALGGETDKARRLLGAPFTRKPPECRVRIHTQSPKSPRAAPVPTSPRIGLHHFPDSYF